MTAPGGGGDGATRRGVLGAAAAGLAATRLRGVAVDPSAASITIQSPGAKDYRPALDAIRAVGLAELEATGLPGMALCVAASDGFAATLSLGRADLANRLPVTPDQLFQIGSISKSLTGWWLNAAADQGRVDLSAPVARYLPDVPLPPEPITLRQLLNHVGGLADDAAPFPSVPTGRLWTGFPPGARFSYSNTGYDLLGLVVERVTGRSHVAVLQEEVLAPLGMAGALAHIRVEDRARYATGYVPLLADRAVPTRSPLREGPWTDEDGASGGVAASAAAMRGYLRYAMAFGLGKGGVLMSDRAAVAQLAADVAAPAFGVRARYASGLAIQTIDGRRLLHHTGGMLMFSSSMHVDPLAGVGCFASVNGRWNDYRPVRTTSHAVAALRAARGGRPPPPADAPGFGHVREPRRLAGRWLAANGDAIELVAGASGMMLVAEATRARLEEAGPRSFVTDHPRYGRHPFTGEPAKGAIARLWWAGTCFARDHPPAPAAPSSRLARLEGSYVAADPWVPDLALFARGDRLWAEPLGEIAERPDGYWSAVDDKGGVDRLWFEAPIADRPSRLNYNGGRARRIA